MVGHPTAPCPYGPADGHGDIAKAQQMVQQSGTAGQSITVWGEQRAPRTQYVEYYADLLNKIGYKATPKLISDATYFPTIGNAKTNPQTGFADWVQDFPNPSDFYLLMNATSIQPVNNENFSEVNDPFIQQQLEKLIRFRRPNSTRLRVSGRRSTSMWRKRRTSQRMEPRSSRSS